MYDSGKATLFAPEVRDSTTGELMRQQSIEERARKLPNALKRNFQISGSNLILYPAVLYTCTYTYVTQIMILF